jgi:hypothetical protein
MKKWILISMFLGPAAMAGNSLPEIAQRCAPLSPVEKPLYSGEFHWGYDLPGMLQKFTEIYHSPKRLPRRASWDARQQVLKLPYDSDRGGDIAVGESFIRAIARQVERAFELKYVDAVFFPDMGHSHLLIPENLMREKYNNYPVPQMSMMYRDMFQDENVEVLYHTAEQLTTLDKSDNVLPDPQIQWRYRTRNIVGKIQPTTELKVLQNPESKANTVHGAAGYAWWGAGFNLSAQENGCFEYRAHGKVYRFDLSMYDLEPDPDTVGDWSGQ